MCIDIRHMLCYRYTSVFSTLQGTPDPEAVTQPWSSKSIAAWAHLGANSPFELQIAVLPSCDTARSLCNNIPSTVVHWLEGTPCRGTQLMMYTQQR